MDASSVHSKTDLSDAERELTREVRDLEHRVSALEQRSGLAAPVPAAASAPIPAAPTELPAFAEAVPVFGRALLGIAGAYLLRALTELGVLPRGAGVAAGIVYAVFWLWLAARSPKERGLAIAVNGLTSAVILGPLLWEATIRFQTASSWTIAAAVAGFSLIGQALSWRKRLAALAGIASGSAAFIAAVLLVATHDLAPFTMALLAIAGGVEFAAYRDWAAGPRWFVAGTADLAVLLISVLTTRKGGLPEGYAAASTWAVLGAQALLVIVYGASSVGQTLVRRRLFTGLEATQTAFALSIGLGGAFQIAQAAGEGTAAVALLAILCGLACYAIAFAVFGRAQNLNLNVYATLAFLLVLGGSFALASGVTLVTVWSAWVLGCCWTGWAIRQRVLRFHGAILLLIASLVSGADLQPAARLFGSWGAPVFPLASGVVAVTAFLSYVALVWAAEDRAVALAISANLAWVVVGQATSGLIAAWQGVIGGERKNVPGATLGTAALTLLALAMAWGGVKWRRKELIWLVYPFMIVAGAKLLLVDLHLDTTLPLVASLLLYGGTLTMLPQILRRGNGAGG